MTKIVKNIGIEYQTDCMQRLDGKTFSTCGRTDLKTRAGDAFD
jgi:hypothetical protein